MVIDYPVMEEAALVNGWLSFISCEYICYSDINECSDITHSCDQCCINTIGSYACACTDGFRLSSDARRCDSLSSFAPFHPLECVISY